MAAGVRGGCEAAVHSLRQKFDSEECEAVLLLDAQNAFNTLNRKLTLHHVAIHCPILGTFLRNIYGCARDLWVGKTVLSSEEGATQGCPTAMGMYSLGLSPLIEEVKESDVFQIFFADDGNGSGDLDSLYEWYRSMEARKTCCDAHFATRMRRARDAHQIGQNRKFWNERNRKSSGRAHSGQAHCQHQMIARRRDCVQVRLPY